jgi:hypothetical protein
MAGAPKYPTRTDTLLGTNEGTDFGCVAAEGRRVITELSIFCLVMATEAEAEAPPAWFVSLAPRTLRNPCTIVLCCL